MTRLNELDLLSPAPYPLARVGHVIAPTLRQVAALGYETYNAYLSLLSLHAEQLFAASGLPDPGGANAFHTLIGNQELRALLCAAFSFFLVEDAVFSQAHSALLCMAEGHPVGIIHEANYEDVCDCILQRNHVDSAQPNRKQFRNDKAREIYEKLQRAKKKSPQQAKEKQADASLPNLISALCVQHNSINMCNVWDLTVYQLYDQFLRQSYLNQVNIHAMNYAGWGGEFDPNDWYKKLDRKSTL